MRHRTIIVMGVSGAGKSAVGSALSTHLGRRFVDADDLHPAANLAKMAQGHPLDDEDRWPWLDAVGEAAVADRESVIACSALRRRYRERLLAADPDAVFVVLDVAREDLESRVRERHHQFMPPSLLNSQLAAFEPLDSDEPGFAIAVRSSVADVVAEIAARLAQ
ncbi:gluconokinase, GntK/IdnK-type [Rathayibacter sp. YIM 133350]|uniref:gluconokinase n=1 Tax=Rathayibacter sp. YIM 133350 TaxID=3131992 RepID=UPI00307D0D17